MKRSYVIIICLTAILASAGWAYWEATTRDDRMQACGYELMDSIDVYYKAHHRLPRYDKESFEFKGKRFFYGILQDSISYYIGYAKDFDNSFICPSTTRRWSDKGIITPDGFYFETLDEINWYNDSCGCLHERDGLMADAIIAEYDLIGKDSTEFLRHFGLYNFREQNPDGVGFGYYIKSVCQDGQMIDGADKTKLIFWFDSNGILTDESSDCLSPNNLENTQ